jgi:leucyl aminopeptidase
MKSDTADIKNISDRGFGAGTITAGLFLSEFVDRTDWIHLDIAESAYKKWTKGHNG